MSRLPASGWILGAFGAVAAICAIGGALWHYGRAPANTPPALPEIQIVQEEDKQTPPADPTLPEAEREFLWDVEHHGNLLNAHGFKKFADALRAADASAMATVLADDFSGHLLQNPRETSIRDDCVNIIRRVQD